MEISIGLAAPAMLRSGGDEPNKGKEWSSKSGSRRVVSTQRLVVGLPTSIGLLNQGKPRSLSFEALLARVEVKPTGVVGVVSRDGNRVLSLVAGE